MKTKLTKLSAEFLESEQASGIILILCMITSIAIANSFFGKGYVDFWHSGLGIENGGIALPALLHFLFNRRTGTQRGIGISVATDISFALGVLASRFSNAVKNGSSSWVIRTRLW